MPPGGKEVTMQWCPRVGRKPGVCRLWPPSFSVAQSWETHEPLSAYGITRLHPSLPYSPSPCPFSSWWPCLHPKDPHVSDKFFGVPSGSHTPSFNHIPTSKCTPHSHISHVETHTHTLLENLAIDIKTIHVTLSHINFRKTYINFSKTQFPIRKIRIKQLLLQSYYSVFKIK